nr:hypothetical protein [Sphingomonas chungangi]
MEQGTNIRIGVLLGQFCGKRLAARFQLLQLGHEEARVDTLEDRGLDGRDGALHLGEFDFALRACACRRRVETAHFGLIFVEEGGKDIVLHHLAGQPGEDARVELILANGEAIAAIGRPFLG